MLSKFSQKAVTALSFLTALTEAAPSKFNIQSRASALTYSGDKVRGVNLGGWFVLEPWITPSLFDGGEAVDEWTFCETLGPDAARSKLEQHWSSFITEGDFQEIAKAGMNIVRIPVGYWAVIPLEGEPYVNGQLPHLDKAISWAKAAGLKVIVDLHGAPGSQNGFDNSGRKGPVNWQQGNTVDRTLKAIQGLIDRYAKYGDTVSMIEALNEPFVPGGVDEGDLKQYYYDTWGRLHKRFGDTTLLLHDGFQPTESWNGFLSGNNVAMDNHHYEVFEDDLLNQDINGHIESVCSHGSSLQGVDKWAVVGEWSGALTDCAKYLNGKGVGARYDGSKADSQKIGDCGAKAVGKVTDLTTDERNNIRRFIEAELDAWEKKDGWIFWTWKNEGAPEWNMKELLAEGVFPQPLNNRKYPGQCG